MPVPVSRRDEFLRGEFQKARKLAEHERLAVYSSLDLGEPEDDELTKELWQIYQMAWYDGKYN